MTTSENPTKLDLSSPLDKPLDMAEIDERMRGESRFMNPPIEKFHLLDQGPSLRDRLANLLHGGKRVLAVGAMSIAGAALTVGAVEYGLNGTNAEHAQLARQGQADAHKYFESLNGEPQSGFDAHGNRIVFENGKMRVIPKSELNQASGGR